MVITARRVPDHSTIAEFRRRHEAALAGLFTGVLGLCRKAGLVRVGLLAVDGMKLHANASQHANRDYQRIAEELLAEAERVDREEDERFGKDQRGDELPEQLRTPERRRAALRQAKLELDSGREEASEEDPPSGGKDDQMGSGLELDVERLMSGPEGRRGWIRDARDQLDEHRGANPRPVPKSRRERLLAGKRLLEEEHQVMVDANAAYEAYRARGVMKDGRRFGRPPDPFVPPEVPEGSVNITGPDSRNLKCPRGYKQGYNAQAVVTEEQIVIAAEINTDSPDFGHLEPMIGAARRQLRKIGLFHKPDVVVADAGYWHTTDGPSRRPGDSAADPTRRGQAKNRPPRVGRRPVHLDALPARDRERSPAIPKTTGDSRAGVRPDRVQPQTHSLSPKRPSRGAQRMAIDDRRPQPPEATQPPNSPRKDVRGDQRDRPPAPGPIPTPPASGRPDKTRPSGGPHPISRRPPSGAALVA